MPYILCMICLVPTGHLIQDSVSGTSSVVSAATSTTALAALTVPPSVTVSSLSPVIFIELLHYDGFYFFANTVFLYCLVPLSFTV